jgi:hypothetical protein
MGTGGEPACIASLQIRAANRLRAERGVFQLKPNARKEHPMDLSKTDSGVAMRMALAGMAPLFSQLIANSPKVKAIVAAAAQAEHALQQAHTEGKALLEEALAKIEAKDAEVIARYAEFREAIGDLLSENGLQGVVDEFEISSMALGAQGGPNRPSAPPPHVPVG